MPCMPMFFNVPVFEEGGNVLNLQEQSTVCLFVPPLHQHFGKLLLHVQKHMLIASRDIVPLIEFMTSSLRLFAYFKNLNISGMKRDI